MSDETEKLEYGSAMQQEYVMNVWQTYWSLKLPSVSTPMLYLYPKYQQFKNKYLPMSIFKSYL